MNWDARYGEDGFAYGTAPNDFLVEAIAQVPKGRVLCLCEGEGRNAVYLAEQGYSVTAVDASAVGMAKAQRLAAERGVSIETIVADLADFVIPQNHFDAVVSIFCHVPKDLRERVHEQVIHGLKQQGVLILEAYFPKQLELGTGGPPNAELMMDLDSLKIELQGLELLHAEEKVRQVVEGKYHTGQGAVVQVIARKP
ncbi:MAG: class I SAM-dependent methyltransferase [Gammaproteobacteria bacterium]